MAEREMEPGFTKIDVKFVMNDDVESVNLSKGVADKDQLSLDCDG
jgi:hypothetical protein